MSTDAVTNGGGRQVCYDNDSKQSILSLEYIAQTKQNPCLS